MIESITPLQGKTEIYGEYFQRPVKQKDEPVWVDEAAGICKMKAKVEGIFIYREVDEHTRLKIKLNISEVQMLVRWYQDTENKELEPDVID